MDDRQRLQQLGYKPLRRTQRVLLPFGGWEVVAVPHQTPEGDTVGLVEKNIPQQKDPESKSE